MERVYIKIIQLCENISQHTSNKLSDRTNINVLPMLVVSLSKLGSGIAFGCIMELLQQDGIKIIYSTRSMDKSIIQFDYNGLFMTVYFKSYTMVGRGGSVLSAAFVPYDLESRDEMILNTIRSRLITINNEYCYYMKYLKHDDRLVYY